MVARLGAGDQKIDHVVAQVIVAGQMEQLGAGAFSGQGVASLPEVQGSLLPQLLVQLPVKCLYIPVRARTCHLHLSII